MTIFNGMDFWNAQSEAVQWWFIYAEFIIIPLAVIILSALIRVFCKKTLIVTGGVFIFFVAIDILFFRDAQTTLMAVIYYFLSFIGCLVTTVCEGILYLINKKRGKADIDAYGRRKTYSSGALQGKKAKKKNKTES